MRWVAALAFLLVACSAQPPVSASATPTPSTCRLPVISGTIWFSSANATRTWTIFRYRGTGMEVMADFSDHPVSVAGPCA
jgi:hypothetical protein